MKKVHGLMDACKNPQKSLMEHIINSYDSEVKKLSNKRMSDKYRLSAVVLAASVSVVLLVVVVWSIMYIISPGLYYAGNNMAIILTLIVIAGVAGLIASLAILAVVINALGLGDPKQALGLPKGSVRAIIALSLIVIFTITAFYYYGQLGGTPSDEQTAFAQQLLTTLSTLVTAIAAFYFGQKSLEAAREAVKQPKLEITKPTSPTTELKVGGEPLDIEVETTPSDEKITWEIAGDKSDNLNHTKPNVFKYEPSKDLADKSVVTITFSLAKHKDVSRKLTINIKNPPSK